MTALDYIQILWDYLVYEHTLSRADLIVGFGSHDITVARRAARLYLEGWAPYLLFSGGLGKGTAGVWQQAEADTFREIATGMGVPEDRILVENQSTNTGDNIRLSRTLLASTGIPVRNVIVVHKPYMGRRIYAALRKQWPEITPIIAPANCGLEEYTKTLLSTGVDEEEFFSILVGDFQRIDVFARTGYQIAQDIPEEAQRAFQELCRLGYTRYVIPY
ncbi:MAG: YdcF family protein [Bacillota bacterium]|nr:YdcF family protein [Bacillota bacterium]